MSENGLIRDPWSTLRRHTGARIALGRAGGSLPTAEVLAFALDHAEARDAVHAELDFSGLERALAGLRLATVHVETLVRDRVDFLRRPDLGRSLSDASRQQLRANACGVPDGCDVALVVADGLCSQAALTYAEPVLAVLVPALRQRGHGVGPVILARYARVALQDDVATELRARASIILLGERPGLHAPVSLGAYFVFAPAVGTTDERRNCVSNIRAAGLAPAAAAETLVYLVEESFRRGISGVHLKDEREVRQRLEPPNHP